MLFNDDPDPEEEFRRKLLVWGLGIGLLAGMPVGFYVGYLLMAR